MSKNVFIALVVFFFATHVIAQNRVFRKDFNKDGVIDRVEISEDEGSAFSSTDIHYTDGKARKNYEFSVQYSFGSFFAICNAPNALSKSDTEELGKLLFSRKRASKIDPSLQWLIDACSNKEEVKGFEIADFSTKYIPIWIEGSPVIPDDYFVLLQNSKFPMLLKNAEGSPEYADKKYKSDYFWLTYSPHSHKGKSDDFNTVQADSGNQLLTTSHGVMLKRGLKYSWVFINDDKLFEANEKLRWPSIAEVQMFNDFVLIRQTVNTGIIYLFIVNPNTGFVVRLKNELMEINSVEEMKVDRLKETIELSDLDGRKYSLTLSKINELFKGLIKP